MGHSLSKALATVDKSDHIKEEEKPKLKSSLMEAERSMREKLESVTAKLYIGALNDECIPIVCAVDKFSNIIFIENVKKIDNGWKKDVADIIKRHLRMPDNGEDNQLTTLVTDVLENLITAQNRVKEYEEEQPIHVVYANESLIRFDYHIHFEILEGDRRALSYYGQVGLIDVKRARLPVLAYELNRVTKEKHLKEAAEGLKKLEELTTALEVAVNLLKKRSESQGMLY